MQTHIYACYLPGSTSPDYIGSHKTEAPKGNYSLLWKYANCVYLGQGVWIRKDNGAFVGISKKNTNTRWGSLLFNMSPGERLAIRVDVLATVDTVDRWKTEAMTLRTHKPPYNALVADAPEVKRAKYNAYHGEYNKGYMARNPDKLAAKRRADMLGARARRAARKVQETPKCHDQ